MQVKRGTRDSIQLWNICIGCLRTQFQLLLSKHDSMDNVNQVLITTSSQCWDLLWVSWPFCYSGFLSACYWRAWYILPVNIKWAQAFKILINSSVHGEESAGLHDHHCGCPHFLFLRIRVSDVSGNLFFRDYVFETWLGNNSWQDSVRASKPAIPSHSCMVLPHSDNPFRFESIHRLNNWLCQEQHDLIVPGNKPHRHPKTCSTRCV